ncbi:MAG: DNA polymerase IV [Proteobacteria bacterium]|nr:DNA polymerase IV [Pseudomonadota bacterium]
MNPKIILCIDMDAYFASVEQKANPCLKEKPIAVIGSGARTIITTSSYEARGYGVKTGMNVYEARKLCPHIIFVVGNNRKYIDTCRELEKIYYKVTPDVEIYSIDEAFLNVTGTCHLFGSPEEMGVSIKRLVKNRFGINCTVGIGPNILMAKLASDLAKPNGLWEIKPEEVTPLLENMPVKKLWGIGMHTEKKLEAMGIKTCGELGRTPVSILRSRFGIIGETLKEIGMGVCARALITTEEEPKSIGHGMTLPKDICDREEMESYILQLSEMVGRRARGYGYMGKTLSLTLRYTDFETFTKQTTLPFYTDDTHKIYRHVLSVLHKIRLKDRVRLIGVRISNIIKNPRQMSLFEDTERRKSLLKAMDEVNNRYGDFKLTWAAYMRQIECPRVISPAWRPSGLRNVDIK